MLRAGILTLFALLAAHEGAAAPACLKDLACTDASLENPEVELASRAIAMLRVVRNGESFVCTGALIADASGSGTPYMLTARHCVATQEEAESIEATWDERSSAGGIAKDRRKVTRTYGADLLATSAETDVALIRLHRIPPDRVFLRAERELPAPGARAYRLSHASGLPQSYTTGAITSEGAGCASAPRPQFIYTSHDSGAVANGSSGAPLLLPGLRIAGHLVGSCGAMTSDACSPLNETVDASIAASWSLLAPYLDPPPVTRRRASRH
jgi:lysyl endopeptidase